MIHRYGLSGAIIGGAIGLVIIIAVLQAGARTPQCVNFNNMDGGPYRCSFGFLNEFNYNISDFLTQLWPRHTGFYSIVSLLVITVEGGVPGSFIGYLLGREYIELRKQDQ
jgi:hypothetical protein